MYIKITDAYRNIITISDKELIGKKFEEGKKQLDIKESFYKGEIKIPEEVKQIIDYGRKEDAIFNIVGERSIQLALEENLITKESIARTANIPYAMILL